MKSTLVSVTASSPWNARRTRSPRLVRRSCVRILAVLCLGTGPGFVQAQSLYHEGSFKALASDRKAHRVGDVVTVHVFEQSSATSSADTTTQRNNSLNASVALLPSGRQRSGTLDVGGAFDGGGITQRTNRLLATLSVTVVELLPNGDLKLAGEQSLTINSEQHKVRLEGRVRPEDLSSDNTVLSTRLADASIHYVGDGDLSSRQRPSWWRRLLDALGF